MHLFVLVLFIALQGRAVTRFVKYYLARHEVAASVSQETRHYSSVEARCKLQCWTRRFTPITFEGTLPPDLSPIESGHIAARVFHPLPSAYHKFIPNYSTLRGPPIS